MRASVKPTFKFLQGQLHVGALLTRHVPVIMSQTRTTHNIPRFRPPDFASTLEITSTWVIVDATRIAAIPYLQPWLQLDYIKCWLLSLQPQLQCVDDSLCGTVLTEVTILSFSVDVEKCSHVVRLRGVFDDYKS